jgi:formamidopyrimidine-DNA glycosylase
VGQTCQRCGTRICAARLGRHWRSTYWCPGCQPLRAPTAD